MTTRFAGGVLPAAEANEELEQGLQALWTKTRDAVILRCAKASSSTRHWSSTMALRHETNAYIEKRAPWKLGKSTEAEGSGAPAHLAGHDGESRCVLGVALMQHVIPTTTAEDQRGPRLHPGCGLARGVGMGRAVDGQEGRGRAGVVPALPLPPKPAA
jgi:methionyl-tRNA synthetase